MSFKHGKKWRLQRWRAGSFQNTKRTRAGMQNGSMNLKNYKSSCLRQKKEKEKRQLCRSGHGHKSWAFYEVFITTWFFFFFFKIENSVWLLSPSWIWQKTEKKKISVQKLDFVFYEKKTQLQKRHCRATTNNMPRIKYLPGNL